MTRLEASSGLTKVLPPNKITFLSEFSYDLYCRGLLDGSSLSSAPKVSTLILLLETHRTSISIPRLVWSAFLGVFYFFECGMAFKCTVRMHLNAPVMQSPSCCKSASRWRHNRCNPLPAASLLLGARWHHNGCNPPPARWHHNPCNVIPFHTCPLASVRITNVRMSEENLSSLLFIVGMFGENLSLLFVVGMSDQNLSSL